MTTLFQGILLVPFPNTGSNSVKWGLRLNNNSYMLKLLSVCRTGRSMYTCLHLYVEIVVSLSDW